MFVKSVMKSVSFLAAASLAALPFSAFAVVDGPMTISYPSIVSGDYESEICLRKQTMMGSFGILQAVYLGATFAPVPMTWVNYDLAVSQQEDNYLAAAPKAALSIVSGYEDVSAVPLYEVSLDLNPLRMSQTSDRATDAGLVRYAKVALISLAKNLAAVHENGLFKLKVKFIGLPAVQQPGTVILPAETKYPYTVGSELFKKIEKETFPSGTYCK